MINAYREVGTYRGAAAMCGCDPKTVKRVIEGAEAGDEAGPVGRRARNYDVVADVVAARVAKTAGRISAKRLLPEARAAGYAGRPGTSGGWWPRPSRNGVVSIIGGGVRRCGRRGRRW